MTRLLYWNVRDFARNKIEYPLPGVGTKRRHSELEKADKSDDRRDYITWLINQVQPDIFVLVETETAYDARGRLVRGNGLEGAKLLHHYIRTATGQNDWRLVPPLQTGPTEGVSVFYRSTRRYFTGPYIWPGGAGATAQPPGGATGNYPLSLRNKLPNRAIPAVAQHNAGINERQVAARISFTRRAGLPGAGANLLFAGRAPYMATFTEVDGGGALVRDLSLFANHSPASGLANQYLTDLAKVAEITDNLGMEEVRSVFGDFNVNLMDNALALRNAYTALQGQGYALALAPVNPAPAAPINGYKGYYATHIKSWRNAKYWSTTGAPVYYPGYKYRGSDTVNNLYAIDNIYTQYGANQNPPPNNRITILNTVVGSPFNLHAGNRPANTPTGTVALPIDMATNNNPPAVGPPYSLTLKNTFRGWDDYRHIYSVSDHFALVIDL